MYQRIKGIDGHLGFRISTKKTNLVEEVKYLHPVKFCELCKAIAE